MFAWHQPERWLGFLLTALIWIPEGVIGHSLHIGVRITLILFISWQLGEFLFSYQPKHIWRTFLGGVVWAGVFSLVLTCLYYASVPLQSLTYKLVESTLGFVIGIASFLSFSKPPTPTEPNTNASLLVDIGLSCLSLGSLIGVGLIAHKHATTISVRTPWPLLPRGSFLLFIIPFSITALQGLRGTRWWATLSAHLSTWMSVSILTPLLYPLGYGFDGFIHRASEQVLLNQGILQPKPLYYIGQYVWITWLASTTNLPLHSLDIWLVPLAIALVSFVATIWQSENESTTIWQLPLLLLFVPLSAFVTTTPQSFSYILAFAAIIACLWSHKQKMTWVLPIALALWATAVHPLGGLPALVFVGGQWLANTITYRYLKTSLSFVSSLATCFVLPFAFWLQSRIGTTPITWSWNTLTHLSWSDVLPSLLIQPRQTLTFWIDAAEWTSLALRTAALLIAVWQLIRPQKPIYRWTSLVGIGLLCMQWMLEHVATFGFLITYERSNYTERLSVLSLLFLAPAAAQWMSSKVTSLRTRSGLLFGMMFALIIALWPLHIYDALPRHDAAKASSGWSVGSADIQAVHWIEEHAHGTPYAVLANQSVSAIALETYGFARYANDVFYYPIPTGGPLYQTFLHVASTEGTPSDLQRAAALTQSDTVFVVINDYWWNADLIRERLGNEADRSISFGNGAVWVYEFKLKKAP